MTTFDDFLGETVTKIWMKRNLDFQAANDEILIDELFVCLESAVLHIRPLVDTDEIQFDLLSPVPDNSVGYENCYELSQLLGRTVSEVWLSTNTRGYFDLLVLGLTQLHPTLLILSEGGVLKLINVDSIFVTVGSNK